MTNKFISFANRANTPPVGFKHTSRILTILLVLLTFGVGQMWGDSVTFDATQDSGSGSITKSPITASTSTMNRSQKDNFRCNSGATLVISSTTATITNISITCTGSGTSDYGPGKFSVSQNGTYSYSAKVGTWSGSSQSITFNASAQVRMTSIVVTYSSGCTGTKLGTPVVTAEASNQQVRLTWQAVSNASGYQLKWNGGDWAAATSPVTKTGLSNGTAYTYQVKAIGNGSTYCDGDASAETSATPNVYRTITYYDKDGQHTTSLADGTNIATALNALYGVGGPISCNTTDYNYFVGWKDGEISGAASSVTLLSTEVVNATTADKSYYAVWSDTDPSAAGGWEVATSITVGDVVMLGYNASKQLSGISTTSTKYGLVANFPSGDADAAYPLTVCAGSSNGTFAFKNSNNSYLYWGSGNSLNVNATLNANTSWTFTYSAGTTTLANASDNTRKIKYNSNDTRFAAYTSAQNDISLYKRVSVSANYITTCCEPLGQINGSFLETTPTSTTFTFGTTDGAESYQVKAEGSTSHADWTIATSPVTISGLTAGGSYTAQFRAHDTNGSNCSEFGEATSFAFTTPLITSSAMITGLDYAEGGTCTAQSFTVSAVGLTAGVRVTAPTNFEVCKTQNGTYTSYVDLDATGANAYNKTITNQTVYVRLASGKSIGSYNGNVTISGGSAADNTSVSLSGTVSSACTAPEITSQPVAVTCNLNETANLSVTATGTDVEYQWYTCDDALKTNAAAIEGEDENSYSAPTSATGTKYYYCVAKSGACPTPSNVVAVTVNTPTITVTESSPLAFSTKKVDGTYTATLHVSGATLAKDAGIAFEVGGTNADMFSVISPASSPIAATSGTVESTEITVQYAPTAKGDHSATLTFSSTGATDVVISLTGTGRYEDTYKTAMHTGITAWSSYADGVTKSGDNYDVPNPGDIAAGDREGSNCQGLHYHFAGWVTDANKEAGTISGNIIAASGTKNANNTTYWAVWEKETSAATGGTESVTWSDRYDENTEVEGQELSIGTNVKVTHNKGTNSTKCQYYTTGSGIRVYAGGNFVVTAPYNISAISLTFGTGDGSNAITASTGTYSSGSWTGSATSVTFSVGGSSGHRRIASISVTYGTPAVYGDAKVECIACTATADAGIVAVDEEGTFSTSQIDVKATSANAGTDCSYTDYGFVWSSSVSAAADLKLVEATGDAAVNCTKVQVGTTGDATSFTGSLTGAFSAGNAIYVRSYVKNENAGVSYQYGSVVTITPRQVTFNMHGHGGNAPASQFVYSGGKVAAVDSPSEQGWTFDGWWDNDGYTGEAWEFATSTVSGANVTLHAKWTAKPKYTITLNAGNGTVSATGWIQDGDVWKQEQVHGDAAIEFPSAQAGCAGWVFQGWKEGSAVTDASEFTADKNADDELVPTSNVTYYAVYRQNATGGTTYNKIESASALTTGDYLFVSNSGYAMKNEVDGTEMKEQGNGISNGASNTTSDAALIWTIIKFDDKVLIKNGSNYLGINDGNNICLTTTPHLFTYEYNTTNSRWEFTSVSKTNYQLIYDSYFKIGTSQSTATLLYKQGAGMTGNYFTNPSCSDLTVTGVADPAEGGTVLLSAASAKAGDKVYAYYEADNAYKFDNWSITGEGSILSSTSNQLTEITVGSANTTVTANFTAKAVATVKFYNNGVQVGEDQAVVEGNAPVAPMLTNGISGDACDETSDMHYGWTTATWVNTKEDLSAYIVYENGDALPTITAGDNSETIIYNAIWAEGTQDELEPHKKIQTLQYDTWTYSGSTTNKYSQNYRLFHTGSYIESEAFDRSQLSKVIVYGGTFGGDANNSLTIGDGTNVWKNVTVSGASETGENTYTDGASLSGVGPIRIISNSGTASNSGVRISKVELYVPNYTYSKFRTACCVPQAITLDVDEEVGKHIEADKAAACAGEVVTISKTENGYFNFGSWNVTYIDGNENTQTVEVVNNQFEMPAYPVTVSANWNPKNYVATVNEPDASLGSIAVSGGSVDQGVRYVAYGSELTAEATPADEDHYFSNWTITSESGSTSVSSNPLNYTMPGSNVTISANFGTVQYPALTVGTSENYTLVAKLANDEDIENMSAIRSGTALKVTFEPNGQYEFTEWSLTKGEEEFTDFDIDGNVITFNMPDEDVHVVVTARAYYELNLLTPENGSISEVVIADEAQSVASLYRVYAGNTISVTAVPTSSSFKFDEWQLDGTAASSELTTATATLTVGSENLSLKAIFAAKAEYTLTLKALGRTHTTLNGLEGASMFELISSAAAAPRMTDQTFLGWSREEDNANQIISQSADLPLNSDYELYAVYQEKAHYYRKVTNDEALTDGQYLIVYEGGNVAFNGGLETLSGTGNTIAVSIDEEKKIAVTNTTTAAEFTIATKEDGFSIFSASGKYIGRTTNDNGLDASETDDYTNAITINNNDADIVCSNAHMRFNSASNELRFRYFKSGTYTQQKAIQLYKRDAPGANKSMPTLIVTTEVNADEIYTDGVAGNIVVEAGGKLTGSNALEVNNLTINSEFAKSGQVMNTPSVNGALYLDIKLLDGTGAMTQEQSQQWYCISAPFDVSMNDGFFWGNGTQMEHNVDFQAFVYDGAKRANNGTSGWQRVSGKMEAGKAYLIGFDDDIANHANTKTIRLKAMTNSIPTASQIDIDAHDADAANKNWNGVGNPTLHYIALNGAPETVQCYDNGSGYNPYAPTTHNYVVGTALFMQAENDIDLKAATNGSVRAPRRANAENERYSFCVELAKEDADRCDSRLYVSTSDEATSSYEPGKDMLTMNGTSAKFAALIWTENYGKRLASEDVPMVNNKATYSMGIFAPNAGTYTISTTEASENATLYLTKNGRIYWNLTMGACELDLAQGQNNEYGLVLRAEAPQVSTGVDTVNGEGLMVNGVQKVIIDEHVYILRGGEMYDMTGKAVK